MLLRVSWTGTHQQNILKKVPFLFSLSQRFTFLWPHPIWGMHPTS